MPVRLLILFLAVCCSRQVFAQETIVLPILTLEQKTVSRENRDAAEALFRQALEAAEKKNGSEAMRLAIKALESDPNHEAIRTLLGFKLHDGCWRTAWEIDRLNKGFVDHPTFGWMLAEHVPRYEAGERFIPPRRWVGAAEEAEFRKDIRNAWEISSEHYDLITNGGLEEGVRISRNLEHLYRAWKLLFFNFLFTEETLAKIFKGRPGSGSVPRHRVVVYRDKDDYIFNLKGIEPGIAVSNGYYRLQTRTSYFFPVSAGMDEHEAETIRKTVYHEATHQLFQEARSNLKPPGLRNNFWIVEGIAMFMETFRIENDRYVVGDINDARLYAAKVHKTKHDYYIPFAELVRLGVADFQRQSQLPRLYSQSAAMTHFLMFHDNGRDRDAVIRLLRLVYAGPEAPRTDSLSNLTGRSYKTLNEEYDVFVKTIPD